MFDCTIVVIQIKRLIQYTLFDRLAWPQLMSSPDKKNNFLGKNQRLDQYALNADPDPGYKKNLFFTFFILL